MIHTANNNLRIEKLVSFIQHDLPGLKDGKYRLCLSQVIQGGSAADFSDTITAQYDLAVLGDRFSFSNPADTIYSVFPAANASGRYDAVLPSVVFTKTSLPWTRSPLSNKAKELTTNDANNLTDEDVPTWLTILLLDEEDLNRYKKEYPDFVLEPRIGTVGDLFPPLDQGDNSTLHYHSYFDDANNSLEPDQQLTDPIEILDIPVPLFQSIAPSVEDLKYMAHIRKVSLVDKATMPGISDIGEPEGGFSIVFGNRLPASNRKTIAYLVSLEGMEHYLSLSPKSEFFKPGEMIRLAVLKSWTFYSTGDNASFVDKMRLLNGAKRVKGTVNKDLSLITTLRLPIPERSIPLVKNALSMGYAPLNHHLRSANKRNGNWQGEKTVSWYRSPLCPYSITAARIHPPLISADQATIYDPTTGMFDVSYAAAWTLGRQMALQDKAFSTKLYNWKRQLSHEIETDTEREHLTGIFANVFEQIPDKSEMLFAAPRKRSFIQSAIASLKEKE